MSNVSLISVIVSIVLGSVATIAAVIRPFGLNDLPSGTQEVAAVIARAHSIASTSGDGATLAFVAAGPYGGTRAEIFAGRPYAGDPVFTASEPTVTYELPPTLVVSYPGIGPVFSLVLNSSGAVAPTGWTVGNAALASEPPCSGSIAINLSEQSTTQTHTIACADATFE